MRFGVLLAGLAGLAGWSALFYGVSALLDLGVDALVAAAAAHGSEFLRALANFVGAVVLFGKVALFLLWLAGSVLLLVLAVAGQRLAPVLLPMLQMWRMRRRMGAAGGPFAAANEDVFAAMRRGGQRPNDGAGAGRGPANGEVYDVRPDDVRHD